MDKINARIIKQQKAKRFLWWWRFPYAGLILATSYLLWANFEGFVGLFLAVSIAGMGLGVIRVDPWRGR